MRHCGCTLIREKKNKEETHTMTKLYKRFGIPLFAAALALLVFAFQALPAFACSGLVTPDGDVRLARTTTFVAWHDGIERYLTSFTYQETNTHSGANPGWFEASS